jgi:hypothetical protein
MASMVVLLSAVANDALHLGGMLLAALNSNFPAALFGALGDAWAAQSIAIRTDRRNRLVVILMCHRPRS